jgi:hypothetical protein
MGGGFYSRKGFPFPNMSLAEALHGPCPHQCKNPIFHSFLGSTPLECVERSLTFVPHLPNATAAVARPLRCFLPGGPGCRTVDVAKHCRRCGRQRRSPTKQDEIAPPGRRA